MKQMKRLKFYAKKPAYPKVAFKVKQGIEPHDRDFLSFIYEHKSIFIKGVKFDVSHITAQPRKKNVLADVLFCMVIVTCSFYYSHISLFSVYLAGNLMGFIIGSLIGLIRIEMQKELARKFNES